MEEELLSMLHASLIRNELSRSKGMLRNTKKSDAHFPILHRAAGALVKKTAIQFESLQFVGLFVQLTCHSRVISMPRTLLWWRHSD